MIGDNRIRETIEVIYNKSDSIYSIDKLQILMYLIDREYYEEYNREVTGCSWFRRHIQPRNTRFNSVLEKLPDENVTGYYIDSKEQELIDTVIDRYNNKSLSELREICRNDEYYSKTNKHGIISFNNK